MSDSAFVLKIEQLIKQKWNSDISSEIKLLVDNYQRCRLIEELINGANCPIENEVESCGFDNQNHIFSLVIKNSVENEPRQILEISFIYQDGIIQLS